jgi:uncharacterized small protein (DUF1192 family)
MDADDLEPRKKAAAKPDLDGWSIGELETYIADLEAEIGRARAVIAAKNSHLAGAEAFFKKRS